MAINLNETALKRAEAVYNDRDGITFRILSEAIRAYLAALPVAPVAQSETADLIERLRGPVFGTQTALDAAAAIETWKARAERLADMHRDMCVVAGEAVARAEKAEAALASRPAVAPVAWRVLAEPDLPVHFVRTEADAKHLVNNLLTYRKGCTSARIDPLYSFETVASKP